MSRIPSGTAARGDVGFGLGPGALAALICLIVVGIGIVLASQFWHSIEKFGLGFWRGTTWDPVAGEFGAFPFIWGTLYSSLLALLISAPIALGIAVFLSELSPPALNQPLIFLTELLPSLPPILYALSAIFLPFPLFRNPHV